MNCPKCQGELTVQPSVSPDYQKANCYNLVRRLSRGKTVSKICGWKGFVKVESKKIIEIPE